MRWKSRRCGGGGGYRYHTSSVFFKKLGFGSYSEIATNPTKQRGLKPREPAEVTPENVPNNTSISIFRHRPVRRYAALFGGKHVCDLRTRTTNRLSVRFCVCLSVVYCSNSGGVLLWSCRLLYIWGSYYCCGSMMLKNENTRHVRHTWCYTVRRPGDYVHSGTFYREVRACQNRSGVA